MKIMKARCTHCQKSIEITAEMKDTEIKCPVCNENFLVSPETVIKKSPAKKIIIWSVIALLVAGVAGGAVYCYQDADMQRTLEKLTKTYFDSESDVEYEEDEDEEEEEEEKSEVEEVTTPDLDVTASTISKKCKSLL